MMSTYKERQHFKEQAASLTPQGCIALLAEGVRQLEDTLDLVTAKDLKQFQGLSSTFPDCCRLASDNILQLVTTVEGLRQLMGQSYHLFPHTDYTSRVNLAALSLREPAQEAALLVRAYAEESNTVTEEALRLRLRVQAALELMVTVADRALLRLNRVVEEAQAVHTTVTAEGGLRLLSGRSGEEGQQQ